MYATWIFLKTSSTKKLTIIKGNRNVYKLAHNTGAFKTANQSLDSRAILNMTAAMETVHITKTQLRKNQSKRSVIMALVGLYSAKPERCTIA